MAAAKVLGCRGIGVDVSQVCARETERGGYTERYNIVAMNQYARCFLCAVLMYHGENGSRLSALHGEPSVDSILDATMTPSAPQPNSILFFLSSISLRHGKMSADLLEGSARSPLELSLMPCPDMLRNIRTCGGFFHPLECARRSLLAHRSIIFSATLVNGLLKFDYPPPPVSTTLPQCLLAPLTDLNLQIVAKRRDLASEGVHKLSEGDWRSRRSFGAAILALCRCDAPRGGGRASIVRSYRDFSVRLPYPPSSARGKSFSSTVCRVICRRVQDE